MLSKDKKHHLFRRIILFYSLVTIVSLSSIATLFISLIREETINEMYYKKGEVLHAIDTVINESISNSQLILKNLYENSQYGESVITFLENGNPDFLILSIDHFLEKDISLAKEMETYLRGSIQNDPLIKSIILYSPERFAYTYYSNSNVAYDRVESDDFLYLEKKIYNVHMGEKAIFSEILYEGNLSLVQKIKSPASFETVGTMIINYTITDLFAKIVNSSKYAHSGDIVIIKDDNSILYSSNQEIDFLNGLDQLLLKDTYIYRDSDKKSHKYTLIKQQVASTSITIVGLIPSKTIYSSDASMVLVIIIVTVSIIFFLIILAYVFSAQYSIRLTNIISTIKKIESGKLSARINKMKTKDELTEIAESFNLMCDTIEESIEKVYVHKMKQKNAELKFLQAQINPHFLYNTLEAIRMRAVVRGAGDVGEMIYILATFFRKSLDHEMITSIEKEVEHCHLYLKLFQLRYKDRFAVHFDINPKLNAYSIVKLSLQPIVENCILHGIDLEDTTKKITISAELNEDIIRISISDNGKGMSPEQVEQLQRHLNNQEETGSIGLHNVHERIQLVYGNPYGLSLQSVEGVGTTVILNIPTIKKSEL